MAPDPSPSVTSRWPAKLRRLDPAVLMAFGCIVLLLVVGSIYSSSFLSPDYLLQQLQVGAFLAMVATGMMIVGWGEAHFRRDRAPRETADSAKWTMFTCLAPTRGRFSGPDVDLFGLRTLTGDRSPTSWISSPEVLLIFLRLGLTSFGGPIAHIGYFRSEFVVTRGWLNEADYADIVALCQFLPGPASSQVAVSLGILRAGLLGGLAAWIGFTLPSATALIIFAYWVDSVGDLSHAHWLQGLKAVAVAVVAQAIWGMARNLCPDRERLMLAVSTALLSVALPSAWGQVGTIVIGAFVGWKFVPGTGAPIPGQLRIQLSQRIAVPALILFVGLLVALPSLARASGSHATDLFARIYRAGSLVFGGGHVVLPLLQDAVVAPGWINVDKFLAGYGAAQAVPGPLFTFVAYLGTAMTPAPNGWLSGLLCLTAIYLPSFLLLIGVLPFWDGIRSRPNVRSALRGVNAAVVGLLMAAFYSPVWTGGIRSFIDLGIGVAAFLLLVCRVPPWFVVILGGVAGWATIA